MEIELKQLTQASKLGYNETQVVMLKVTGPVDTNNRIVQSARRMIESKGSKQALDSFDAAVAAGLLRSDR
jgi:hypothetical protein